MALWLGIGLAILITLVVLALTAYFAGILHVLTVAAWTLAFLSLDRNRAEKIIGSVTE